METSGKKNLGIWMGIGFILFAIFIGGFTILAKQYACNIDMESLANQSDQLVFSDGSLTVMDNNVQIYFDLGKDIFINYLSISVQNLSAPTVNGRLYYANSADDIDETKVVNFYLKEGFNEIRASIGEKKYFRLDILGGGLNLMQ